MAKTIRPVLPLALLGLVAFILLGCGGGGGGGSSGVGATVPETPPTLDGLARPAGYQSSGFPVTEPTITLPGFGADNKALAIFANTYASEKSGQLTASLGTPASLRLAQRPADAGQTMTGSVPGAAFLQRLRQWQAALPVGTGGRASLRATPRAATLNEQVTFQMPKDQVAIPVTAICRKIVDLPGVTTGGKVCFFVDKDDGYSTDTTGKFIDTLADHWVGVNGQTSIYTTVRQIFGEEPPATFNNLALGNDIIILITSKVSTIDRYLAGFFWSGDLIAGSSPSSNQRKMFYLTNITAPEVPDLTETTMASTMAHEFQHMVNFYQRHLKGLQEDTWLNEAMSGYAEHVCGFSAATNNQSKALQINRYFEAGKMPTVSLTNWKDDHENYGLVYLFGTWLGQKFSPNKDGTVKNLLASAFKGEQAVAQFAGESFDKVFSKFMVMLAVNNPDDPIYGITGLDLKGTFTYGGGLAPVTLTGPQPPVAFNGYPYNTGSITIAPRAGFAVALGNGNGSTLTLRFTTSASAFQLHK
ncbi:MAG: Secreted protease metal-dependent protease [Candidatus Ozemobacter sibiricus]|jgi:hypothetical protein|uniref:Secreted protease metal-dependent protease n=1 Tax=Candidatus Ozemobacter sibiricus TaxID=2268124 RepID=A0A367ZQM4_9BACT|nr:MAG: Secreted protease metal-dependent protease [Candidatus Ozemobacter sibiricus]